MPGIHLFTSNKMEHLVDALGAVVKAPLRSPFDPEIIVVQNRGMERWISMRLAEEFGVWANCEYPFPNAFVKDVFEKTVGAQARAFDPEILIWKLIPLLKALPDSLIFDEINRYLSDPNPLKIYQLGSRTAELFDQYTVYRPDMLTEWEKSTPDNWQTHLWNQLILENGPGSRVHFMAKFFDLVKKGSLDQHAFPERVHLFGISTLPPFHIAVLSAIAQLTDINIFLLNPCMEYWDDIVSEKEFDKLLKKKGRKFKKDTNLHFDQGNPLLASFGMHGRDFLARIHDLEGEEFPLYSDSTSQNALSVLKSDILHLHNRGSQNGPQEIKLSEKDFSVQVHSVHAPMREIEILYDNLLNLFETLPNLKPSDIAVMSPDIETYSPYIEAVFGAPEDGAKRIPFSLADRSIRARSKLAEKLLDILKLPSSRFTTTSIMALLESSSIQKKYSLSENELELITNWVRETGIRWGVDQFSRSKLGLPEFKENSWKSGIERLLLGYALPNQNETLFEGIAGYDAVEGSHGVTIGKFLDFTQNLFRFMEHLERHYSLNRWSEVLIELLEGFFDPENHDQEYQQLRTALLNLGLLGAEANYHEEVSLEIVRAHLEAGLGDSGSSPGFLNGGVTFCAMVPMRSIPFRVVCLIGMNDDTYPRKQYKANWDLIAKNPRRGDRVLENEDRYLFLEAIISAQDVFYISYVGQSIRDNSLKRPSIVVNELLDYLDNAFSLKSKVLRTPSQLLTRHHRLQAFSPIYFATDSTLMSYSEENCEAIRALTDGQNIEEPFFKEPLELPDNYKSLTVKDLARFFNNPVKYLIEQRLGISLKVKSSLLEENEPFKLGGLEGYSVNQVLIDLIMKGQSKDQCLAYMRASGYLPQGSVGVSLYNKMSSEATLFSESIQYYYQGNEAVSSSVDLCSNEIAISGNINNLLREYKVNYRFADRKAKDIINFWIEHVILNCLGDKELPTKSILICKNGAWELSALDQPEVTLKELVSYYLDGITKPTHFFPTTSFSYAEAILSKGKSPEEALESARKCWDGNDFQSSEKDDAYYKVCFKTETPLDQDFERISLDFFEPVLRCLSKIREIVPVLNE